MRAISITSVYDNLCLFTPIELPEYALPIVAFGNPIWGFLRTRSDALEAVGFEKRKPQKERKPLSGIT